MDAKAWLAAIAAEPDADLPRLAYADWLEENGQPRRAEAIRLACQLDPHRDDQGEVPEALRERAGLVQYADERAERQWLYAVSRGKLKDGRVRLHWRRGFVDALELPARWFVEYGAAFGRRCPLLRKLVLFRLNGWGGRLAGCEWLRGLGELELACWYADEDAAALAASPHLGAVERLTLWSGGGLEQARTLARAAAWPKLRELHLVSQEGPEEEWARAVNEAAGRPLASVYDFSQELLRFPFAADFDEREGFLVGRLPGGEQLFAWGPEYNPTADGWLFHPDGTRKEPFRFPFPPELLMPFESEPGGDWQADLKLREQTRAARRALLAASTGFVPAFIRVEDFAIPLEDDPYFCNPSYDQEHDPLWDHWGQRDDPDEALGDGCDWIGGAGESVYRRVQAAEYKFYYGDMIWGCDRTGEVVFT
jgi:uncharacterized protein (TIGR02996 family)